MRIPYPTSIPLLAVIIVLSGLLTIQLAEGTDPVFAVTMAAAQVFGIMAFNTLGGMSHVTGSFCLFSLLANVTVPEIAHAMVLQPGDYNLPASLKAAAVDLIFYASLYAAARLVILLHAPSPYLDRVKFTLVELRATSVLAIILATALVIMSFQPGGDALKDGSLLAALHHFYPILNPLSVVLATYVQLKSTQGRSPMGWLVAAILVLSTFPGVFGASKEGMLTPLFCWIIVCATFGYRFSRTQVVALAALLLFAWLFVYPFSQNARVQVRSALTMSERISVIFTYIRDPSLFPSDEGYLDPEYNEYGEKSAHLGIIQRFSLLRSNGMLVDSDEAMGYTGVDRYLPVFLYVIPHFVWPDRPLAIESNELGHKAGFHIDRNDTSTGIAISSPALFYDIGGWVALPVYTIVVFGLFFYALRSLVGSSKQSVWGLMMIGATALVAGAALPSGPIELIQQFVIVFGFLVVALKVISYVTVTMFAKPVTP